MVATVTRSAARRRSQVRWRLAACRQNCQRAGLGGVCCWWTSPRMSWRTGTCSTSHGESPQRQRNALLRRRVTRAATRRRKPSGMPGSDHPPGERPAPMSHRVVECRPSGRGAEEPVRGRATNTRRRDEPSQPNHGGATRRHFRARPRAEGLRVARVPSSGGNCGERCAFARTRAAPCPTRTTGTLSTVRQTSRRLQRRHPSRAPRPMLTGWTGRAPLRLWIKRWKSPV
mmetsp:Transcript_73066/g.202658  ORF Transcript_73066/g.202658 Transcript_73066/m.202658 type:complete len:229 (-) Transcript_73066:888-1574(-)